LFHAAGSRERAIELCFAHGLRDQLAGFIDDVMTAAGMEEDGASTIDAGLLGRCAAFFAADGRASEACSLLAKAGRVDDAIALAESTPSVTITDELADLVTPAKVDGESALEEERRKAITRRVAKLCKSRGAYHLACKKYTQAGEKVKAVKALTLSGDREKIVFFAGVSRAREVYVVAANYLRTLPWQDDADLTKQIATFYRKANATDLLVAFYESVARSEIDEVRPLPTRPGSSRGARRS
jgi:intraflagellar transport protein 140